MDRIFVVIPSFQEEDLENTVESIFKNASDPNRIFVGICNQRSDESDFETFYCYGDHVRLIELRSPRPLGLGLAYYSASKLLQGEEFFLRIDAHTRMKKDWDSTLLACFGRIEEEEKISKIIISQLTGGFYKIDMGKENFIKSDDEDIWLHETEPPNSDKWMNELIRQLKKYIFNTEHLDNNHYIWNDEDRLREYKEVHMISGSFHFSKSQFLLDCTPDPRVFFWGEEHVLALRAWTHGYRIFSMDVNTQFTGGKPQEYLHGVGINDWRNFNSVVDDNLKESSTWSILSGLELGFYGAKDKESYDAYMEKIGFNKLI
jgi:hypothetical protein